MGRLPRIYIEGVLYYVTSKGVRLEGNGVVPDFEVKEPIAAPKGAPDEAIEKACSVLAHTKSVK